jgi:hypothetical protein
MANTDKMAIAKTPKELARKLVKTNPQDYVVGRDSKAGLKKFSDKHPVLRTNTPSNDEDESEKIFNGSNLKKELTTRRADYDGNEAITAYESETHGKLIEKFVKKDRNPNGNLNGTEAGDNAQKLHAVKSGEIGVEAAFDKAKPHHEKTEKKGIETSQPIGKIKTALPSQSAWSGAEETELTEAAEMSDAAHELSLHADNDRHLYRNSHVPVAKNLEKKFKKGSYDHEKAKKLWGYHADRAAQSYSKQHGDVKTPWHKMFTTADRKQAASHMADKHQAEMDAGNFHSENVEWNDIPALNEMTAFTYIAELGDQMAPAPASGDNPGGADSASAGAGGKDSNDQNKNDEDSNEDSNEADGVRQAKEDLEEIAMAAAELYENISDGLEMPSWILEKLDLAKNFVSSVQDFVDENSDEDGEGEDDPEGNKAGEAGKPGSDQTNTQKPTAYKEEVELGEASYSAKAAAAGKDIGKPGKNFAKIAAKASKKYGSKESGEKVAGAILAKIRAKHGVK